MPDHGTTPAQKSFSEFLSYLHLRAAIRAIAQEKGRCIYVHEMDDSHLKAIEDDLSDAF